MLSAAIAHFETLWVAADGTVYYLPPDELPAIPSRRKLGLLFQSYLELVYTAREYELITMSARLKQRV